MAGPLVSRLVVAALLAATLAPPALHARQRPTTATATIAPLVHATPESVGFAPSLAANMDTAMQGLVDQHHLALWI